MPEIVCGCFCAFLVQRCYTFEYCNRKRRGIPCRCPCPEEPLSASGHPPGIHKGCPYVSPKDADKKSMHTQPDEQPQQTSSLLGSNRDLAVLYAIAGYLNHKVDVHEALQEVLARVTEMLGLRTGWVWLLNEQSVPYLAAAQALPPYLADHYERMAGSCLCLDTFLSGDMATAA